MELMDSGSLYVEVESSQAPKRAPDACGDVIGVERTPAHTTLVLSDGMGHGIIANIAAQMSVSRMLEFTRQGYPLRRAFERVVASLETSKGTQLPYAVLSVLRVMTDGIATALVYEMPPPLLVTPRYVQQLHMRRFALGRTLIGEANCQLESGEGVMLVTDGITQAGIGSGMTWGQTIEGVSRHITSCLSEGARLIELPELAMAQARSLWGWSLGDDCTAVIAACRGCRTVNILTGPPSDKSLDRAVINQFMSLDGTKVICGGTTAQIAARCLNRAVRIEKSPASLMVPPRYEIDGIDLVTEGAITLNQVFNVIDMDPETLGEDSGVSSLHSLLKAADRVNILIGQGINPATLDVSFRQRGILTRQVLIPLISRKLREAGKLVVVENVG